MKKLLKRLLAWVMSDDAPPALAPVRKRLMVTETMLTQARGEPAEPVKIERYEPPPGVIPALVGKTAAMAMDFTNYDYVNTLSGGWAFGAFRGFPYLAQLAQQPEYRKITSIRADEMVRKWIRLTSKGDGDKTERLEKLGEALDRLNIRDLFHRMAEYDGFYGRGQLYVSLKAPQGDDEAQGEELATPLLMDKAKIKKGSLLGFVPVEPVWTYPGAYNSTDPLKADFYRPILWYVMGKTVHRSRLITFISREVPDMLKASYNFSGLSMSQMAQPYVDNWLRTRDSVGDLIHAFSTSGLMTDMGAELTEGNSEDQLDKRMELFNLYRDNKGLMMLNKDTEEFFQFNTPLSGLDKLQAQAQEQQSAVASIPLVKLFGITPAGLNASTDGEIEVFENDIHASQEDNWRVNLKYVIDIVQLSEFGEIDDSIGFEFLPLKQPNLVEQSTIRKTDADTDAVLINSGVITTDESRERLINDPDNTYHNLQSNTAALSIEEEQAAREEQAAAELEAKTAPSVAE